MAIVPVVAAEAKRVRLRELLPNVKIGSWPVGPKNGITDVPGVLVHTESIIDKDRGIHTGITTILPRRDWMEKACYSGMFSYNGCGELTGHHWIADTGLLGSPIVLSNTFAVGACHTGVLQYAVQHYGSRSDDGDGIDWFLFPVVGETFDGTLNNLSHFAVTPEHVIRGIEQASPAAVPEGNTGGGTAMTCQGFKGGTGTSSRVIPGGGDVSYTVGVLVQANYGTLYSLTVAGAPVGRILWEDEHQQRRARGEPARPQTVTKEKDGSIIVIIATDAPLLPVQLQRLARRATRGLSRVGGYGNAESGDIFMAFSTGSEAPGRYCPVREAGASAAAVSSSSYVAETLQHEAVDERKMDGLFEAVGDATEEAILNALCMAETMTGFNGRTVEAMPLERVRAIVQRHIDLERELSSAAE